MAYRDNPPTDCGLCRDAEMTAWERTVYVWREIWREMRTPAPTAASTIIAAYGNMLAVVIGTVQPTSRYDQHRAMYMQTGDQIWVDRMLRHLEPRD